MTARREESEGGTKSAAFGLAIAGITSLALMVHAGRHQRSVILILLFVGWVVSPFLGLLYGYLSSRDWSSSARRTLHALTLAVVFICPGIYALAAFGYTNLKMGFVFLVVPLACWVLIGLLFCVALLSSRNSLRKPTQIDRH